MGPPSKRWVRSDTFYGGKGGEGDPTVIRRGGRVRGMQVPLLKVAENLVSDRATLDQDENPIPGTEPPDQPDSESSPVVQQKPLSVGPSEQDIQAAMPWIKKASPMTWPNTPNVDVDDLVQYGLIGFLEAFERYNLVFGASFETYAWQRGSVGPC